MSNLLSEFRSLLPDHPLLVGVVACTRPAAKWMLRGNSGFSTRNSAMRCGRTSAV